MDRRISEISDDMAGIDGIGDCDEKSFSPSGRRSDICTSAKAETHFDRDCRSFNDCFLMYYDIFRVQSSTVYDGSDVSGDADSDGFDLRSVPNRWSFDDYGTAPYLYRTLKKQECTGRTERIYRLVKEAAIC